MGDDLAALRQDLSRLSAGLSGSLMREVMTDIGVAAKKDIAGVAARDVGADLRLSGWGRSKLSSGFELTSDTSIEIAARPRGIWRTVAYGRKASPAPTRKRGWRKMRTPWGWRTYSRESPLRVGATRGKGTWDDAVAVIEDNTPGRALDAIHERAGKILGT